MPLTLRALLSLLLAGLGGGAIWIGSKTWIRGRGDAVRSSLERAIDGGDMEPYLEEPSEKAVLLEWLDDGAPRNGWKQAGSILKERCVVCHDGETMPQLAPLDRYEVASRLAQARPLLAEKIEWGTMQRYLPQPQEQRGLLEWMEKGSPEGQWSAVARILMDRCVSCHNPETGVPGLVALDRYGSVFRIATLPPQTPAHLAVAGSLGALIGVGIALRWLWDGRRRPG